MNNVEIEITKIVNGGYGLGRLPGGQVILVRHSLPNESHIVTVSNEKKNLCYGSTRQILVSNSERRPAPCPYYHDCGGCDLQHCHYPYQTAIKKSILIDMLARLGNGVLKNCVVQIQPVLAASEEFHYRQRIRLQIGKRGELGFNRFRSNTITPISACLLAAPPINVCLSLLREKKEANSLLLLSREIELQYNPGSGRIFAIFYLLRKPRPADNQAAKKLTESSPLIEAIYFAGSDFSLTTPTPQRSLQEAVGREKSHQPKVCYPTIEGLSGTLSLGWEPGSFCQVNLEQNRMMIEKVLDFGEIAPGDSVLDLFCGMGNFSIPFALQGATVAGYEGQGAAIRAAIRNSYENGVEDKTSFSKKPVHQACEELVAAGRTFDCTIIDPPRQGGPQLADQLYKLTKKKLIYVSCDPATLIRDLNDLTTKGFAIEQIQPIDMFPQTHHIETIVQLKRQ